MNQKALKASIKEAKRFIAVAEAAKGQPTGSPETAAAKRASMDLTRVLAKMRNTTQYEEYK